MICPPALTHVLSRGPGHSERRTIFGETSELVAQKTRAAIDAGLSVILCIGETLEEREAGKCKQVVETQLKAVVQVTKEADWRCASCPPKRISVRCSRNSAVRL
jgi:triosephosphate isomerase